MAPDLDTGAVKSFAASSSPTFKVDGKDAPALNLAAIAIEISDDVAGMARLEATFDNWGTPPGGGPPGYMFFDGGAVSFGKELEVSVGPPGASSVVFKGHITSVGARFGSTRAPELTVRAEDDLQLFRFTRRTRTYEDVTDAEVAEALGKAHKLDTDCDAAGPRHRVLVQVAQTDLAFLRERAAAIDAQVWVADGKLMFKARKDRDGGEVQLTLGKMLRRFDVVADLADQVVKVFGHGWDVGGKEDPNVEAAGSLLADEAGGASHGADVMQKVFGAREDHIVDRPATSRDEADALARTFLLRRGRSFVRGTGETEGTAALKVGAKMKLLGVGPIFEGTYVAIQVTHRWDRTRGFHTGFAAERPAVGKES
ncbi:MAG TPA: contractile injection system protein, VgrG/Pvc8 family [Kofleriaceae bacterium]|nr:contractile injection system protein, VgrG/Pvc8 family [Kofleriaceae bacterium]